MNQNIIAIIDEYTDKSNFTELGIKTLSLSKGIFDDVTIDEFIINELKPQKPSILIIPASLGSIQINYWGLRVGMHIRLSSAMEEYRFIPIIFVSQNSLEEILRFQEEKLGLQCTLDGSLLVGNSIDEIQAAIDYLEPIDKNRYVSDFVEKIIIKRPPEIGKHSLANIWGAIRLNEVLNLNAIDKILLNRTKELYFKYLRAFHEESKGSFKDLQPLQCTGKRILLIDDEADKGWNDILKAIFKNADFQSIDFNNKTFKYKKESIKKVKDENWDLILLDLRLNPSEEDTINKLIKTEDYSGAKILKKLKKHNAGIQVIMLTASNKAWNMKKLLDLGADGYYIKESPEFNFSPILTKENYEDFEKQVKKCFEKGFLIKIFQIHKRFQDFIKIDKQHRSDSYRTFYDRSEASLEIAFELLKKFVESRKYLNLAYLTYYQILEDYAKENFEYNSNSEIGKCIVKKNGESIIVIQSGKGERDSLLTFQKGKDVRERYNFYKKQNGKYLKNDYDALGKISFILAFKFNKDNDYLKKWGKLNGLRNDKAGHGGNKGYVSILEIKELLEIVELFLTEK
jgi:CheY-like chemotaxis protein